MTLGKRIKELLRKNDIRQSKLAREIGVSQGAMSNYANDIRTPSAEVLKKMEEFFGEPLTKYGKGINKQRAINEISFTFARSLEEIMLKKGVNQTELALITGVSRPTISKCLNGQGNPKLDVLVLFADALDVTVNEIIGETYSKKDVSTHLGEAMISSLKRELSDEEKSLLVKILNK